MKLFLAVEDGCWDTEEVRDSAHFRLGSTARRARPSSRATPCSCARNRRSRLLDGSRDQFRRYFEARAMRAASPAKRCCSYSSGGSTTSFIGWASRRRAQARQLVRHGHFLVNGKKSTFPRTGPRGRSDHRARPEPAAWTIGARDEEVKAAEFRRGFPSTAPRLPAAWCRCRRASRSICPCRNSSSSSCIRSNSVSRRPAALPDLRREAWRGHLQVWRPSVGP